MCTAQELVKGHNIEVGQETAYEAFLGEVAATDSQPAAEISDTNKCAAKLALPINCIVCKLCHMRADFCSSSLRYADKGSLGPVLLTAATAAGACVC